MTDPATIEFLQRALADLQERRMREKLKTVAQASRAIESEKQSAYWHARMVVAEHERDDARALCCRLEQEVAACRQGIDR